MVGGDVIALKAWAWLPIASVVEVVPPRADMSAQTSDLKVGAVAAPVVGPAKTRLAAWVGSVIARVPVPVIGEPEIDSSAAGTVAATLVTVPPPALVADLYVPSSDRNRDPAPVPPVPRLVLGNTPVMEENPPKARTPDELTPSVMPNPDRVVGLEVMEAKVWVCAIAA